ncbi:MAG: isoamylase early set domain-containing protein [Desulfobulbaceae bacterium]|nr:isoamylase early set domain-containing protein [Desulfobulbaceae bacterium]
MAGKTTNATSKTKSSAKKKTIQSTEFSLTAPEAKQVFIAGDFNDWNASEHAMRKFKDGKYSKMLKLKPGRYEYQFIVDGQWWTDPANPNRQPNSFGSENSVIEIGDNVVC